MLVDIEFITSLIAIDFKVVANYLMFSDAVFFLTLDTFVLYIINTASSFLRPLGVMPESISYVCLRP